MYIRQDCIFSFEDALKIQPQSRLEKIINTLDYKPVLSKLNKADKVNLDPNHIQHMQCLMP